LRVKPPPVRIDMEDLVIFPEENKKWKDSGEGGLAVFFVLLNREDNVKRQKCCAGDIYWTEHNVVAGPKKYRKLNNELSTAGKGHRLHTGMTPVDLAMLIASTNKSLYDVDEGYYFVTEKKDLTPRGLQLFHLITTIYKHPPDIVTLLDT